MRRSRLAAGLSVLVIAYTVRLIYLHQIASSVLFDFLQLDPLYYYQWATRIAAGDWLGSEVFEMSPLYSYLLAVHLLVFGSDLWILRLVQMAVGSLTCLLTFLLGARLFNTRVGLLAGLACAVYGPLLFYEGQVMKEFLTPALATGALLLICSPRARAGAAARRGPWLGAGALLGLAALVRGNFLLLILILAVWAFFAAGRRFTFVVPFAFGTALVLLPVAARNYAVSGDLVLTTSGGGEVFYIGNGPFANGAYVPPPWVRSNPMYEHQDFRDRAEEITGRPLTRAEASRFWWRRTAAWILRHPGRTALLWMRKFALFWNDHELPDNYSYDTFTRFSPLLSRMLTFGPVALLAWVGLLWSARDAGRLVPLYLVLAGYMTSVLLFFNFARFRLPAVPILCVFAAFGIDQVVAGLRAWWRRRRLDWRPVISALLLVFAGPFMYIDWSSSADEPFQDRLHLAAAFRQAGRLDEAEETLRQVIAAATAVVRRHGGDPSRAGEIPGGVTFALALSAAHRDLAGVLEDQGHPAQAAEEFRRAVALAPDDVPLRLKLAAALKAAGDRTAAAAVLREALRHDPTSFAAGFDLATIEYELGHPDRALDLLERARRRASDLGPLDLADYHYGMGTVLFSMPGRQQEAAKHFAEALRLNPEAEQAGAVRDALRRMRSGSSRPDASPP